MGVQWAQVYDHDSPSRKLITEMMETYFLVNVVHNDFTASDGIFKGFFEAASAKAAPAAAVNGLVNGVINGSLGSAAEALHSMSQGLAREIQAQS